MRNRVAVKHQDACIILVQGPHSSNNDNNNFNDDNIDNIYVIVHDRIR